MVIRKGKLYKPCIRCRELFEPTGKYNYLCPKCQPKQENTFWHRMQRLSEKKKKKNKDERGKKDNGN